MPSADPSLEVSLSGDGSPASVRTVVAKIGL